MTSIIYKPQTAHNKGPVILTATEPRSPPTMTLADGTVITAVRGDKKGSTYFNEGSFQWIFPNQVLGQKGATLSIDGQTQKLEDTNSSYRGNSLGTLTPSTKGAVGDTTTGNSTSNAFTNVGQYGVAPNFIGDQFPNAVYAQNAGKDYKFTDPIAFGKQFATSQNAQLAQNFQNSKGFALGSLDTELQGLQNYVPKSAALKQGVTAQDNAFNQAQRTAQINSVLGPTSDALNTQLSDAQTYASGQAPNSVVDSAMNLGTRSAAADVASSSGFGVGSSAARKLSDLQSAQTRIGLSQYGNSLIQSNTQQQEALRLAPTEYTNAGSQINVAPSISGSQLQQSNFGVINQANLIDPSNAFSSQTQQNQYLTNLEQASNNANASTANEFALSYFSYLNSYANSVASAGQTNANTTLQLNQQQQAQAIADKFRNKTQRTNDFKSGLGAIGSIAGVYMASGSDIRLKKDIVDYTAGADDIAKLNIIRFTYKQDSVAADGNKPHIGVIAQELQKIFPSAVGMHSTGYLQIDPSEVVFALVSAVQKLTARVMELEKA